MLAFGIKVAWFCLSLSGLLSSIAALPAFAQALDGYLIPVLYSIMDLVLQGLLCIGMTWKMDPFEMPRPFCIAQPALMGVAWSFMTVITTCTTFATSRAILRPVGGVPAGPAYIRSHLQWHPMWFLLVFFPLAAIIAYLALVFRFNAVEPVDGMHCDATTLVWVRLLSYAGVPLLLALPSFALTCTAAFQYYAHSPRHSRSYPLPHSNDHFTPVPLRRQSKMRFSQGWGEVKAFDKPPVPFENLLPELSPSTTKRSVDQRSTTPSGTIVVAEAIPSPPESLSSARGRITSGRAPVSPGVGKPGTRYHLPFQWQRSSPPTPSDPLRDSSETSYSRHTPSPLVFAKPLEDSHLGHTTTTVSITPEPLQRIYDAAPWLKDEKAYLRHLEKASAYRQGIYDNGEHYDAISRPLRRGRNSDDTISTVKSEIEFARSPQRLAFGDEERMVSPVDVSTYDAALTETPMLNPTRLVWRILFFQLLTSATQILATISSLVDMFSQHNPPAAFGTHHVAFLLATWASPVAFGFIPWCRKAR